MRVMLEARTDRPDEFARQQGTDVSVAPNHSLHKTPADQSLDLKTLSPAMRDDLFDEMQGVRARVGLRRCLTTSPSTLKRGVSGPAASDVNRLRDATALEAGDCYSLV
jgi:hypothetical protein